MPNVSVGTGDRAYNTASSGEAQGNFQRAAAALEAAIDQRDQQVKAAMSSYEATNVSEDYQSKEQNWNTKAQAVKDIIRLLKTSLEQNDETATTAIRQAGNAVANIAT